MRFNLHIAGDDKFFNAFINSAQKIKETRNRFVVYTIDGNKPVFVESQEIASARYGSDDFFELIGDWCKYDAVYIHYLSKEMVDFISKIPPLIKVVWCFYGADAFSHYKIRRQLLSDRTRILLSNEMSISGKVYTSIERKFHVFRNYTQDQKKFRKALKRVDFFAHYIKEDYELIKRLFDFRAQYVDFTYGNIEDFRIELDPETNAKDILLGNSGSETNNHLDILEFLKLEEFDGYIYCPLSYGGTNYYIESVIKVGHQYFGEQFIPLVDFQKKDEYQKMLNNVGIAIMNHYRSQAHGNILSLLYAGKTVVMNKKSSLYQLYNSLGLNILLLEDIKSIDLNAPLYDQLVHIKNMEILNLEFGEELFISKLNNLLKV